jgi:hypothetical protein
MTLAATIVAVHTQATESFLIGDQDQALQGSAHPINPPPDEFVLSDFDPDIDDDTSASPRSIPDSTETLPAEEASGVPQLESEDPRQSTAQSTSNLVGYSFPQFYVV